MVDVIPAVDAVDFVVAVVDVLAEVVSHQDTGRLMLFLESLSQFLLLMLLTLFLLLLMFLLKLALTRILGG